MTTIFTQHLACLSHFSPLGHWAGMRLHSLAMGEKKKPFLHCTGVGRAGGERRHGAVLTAREAGGRGSSQAGTTGAQGRATHHNLHAALGVAVPLLADLAQGGGHHNLHAALVLAVPLLAGLALGGGQGDLHAALGLDVPLHAGLALGLGDALAAGLRAIHGVALGQVVTAAALDGLGRVASGCGEEGKGWGCRGERGAGRGGAPAPAAVFSPEHGRCRARTAQPPRAWHVWARGGSGAGVRGYPRGMAWRRVLRNSVCSRHHWQGALLQHRGVRLVGTACAQALTQGAAHQGAQEQETPGAGWVARRWSRKGGRGEGREKCGLCRWWHIWGGPGGKSDACSPCSLATRRDLCDEHSRHPV